ncbi:alpha/beta fold hydrolase, partial [Actinomadura adrarensis]
RTASSKRLGAVLLGKETTAPDAQHALDEAVAQFRRPGIARRTARRLNHAQRKPERAELRRLLATCPVPLHVITGKLDPLADNVPDVPVTVIDGAGHHPHLTHPAEVAAAITTATRERAPH